MIRIPTTITNCRQTYGTVRKSNTTITRQQEDKLSKASLVILKKQHLLSLKNAMSAFLFKKLL